MAARKKIVVKVEVDDSQSRKAIKALSTLRGTTTTSLLSSFVCESVSDVDNNVRASGIEVISVNTKHGKITVVGVVNPVDVLGRLRKKLFPNAEIVAVEPVMETNEITYEFLNHITNNFSEERIIGRGGHGVVFKVLYDYY
ncbi:hypothetical protein CFC21_095098 [Triticum aestivum]|uniref:Uncharacterized protein n=4 Tax=Triticum TaxID=4564 RepID=A0A9R0YZ57_TRITD|nr:hypothetical protein TRIUR3_19688 [Triticum urartu]KAF7092637.1 hypothetical protein CFC21_095098 [Triticum aestivum]VAI68398.1 unnamed protein product [Triticum turgidum subsp. durum]